MTVSMKRSSLPASGWFPSTSTSFHLHHGKDRGVLALGALALQPCTYLGCLGELAAGYRADQCFVAVRKSFTRHQGQAGLVTGHAAFQRSFNLGQGVLVTAMQVDHGFLALLNRLAFGISQNIAQGDNGVFFNFHVDAVRSGR